MRPPPPIDPPPDVEDAVALLGITEAHAQAVPRRRAFPQMVALGLGLGAVGTVAAGVTALGFWNAMVPVAAIHVGIHGVCGGLWDPCWTGIHGGAGLAIP